MTTTNAAPGDLSGLPEVPMSGDLLTTLRVEPGRLGRLLDGIAIRATPAYSPHPTDPPVDLDAVGHIMPIRSAS